MHKLLWAVIFITGVWTTLQSEKFAVIYTELPELPENEQTLCKFNMKEMEKAWKTTYLKWENLICNDGFKKENIRVLYCEGIDLTKYMFAHNLNERFRPENILPDPQYTIVNSDATQKNYETEITDLRKKMKANDEILVYIYGLKKDDFTNQILR